MKFYYINHISSGLLPVKTIHNWSYLGTFIIFNKTNTTIIFFKRTKTLVLQYQQTLGNFKSKRAYNYKRILTRKIPHTIAFVCTVNRRENTPCDTKNCGRYRESCQHLPSDLTREQTKSGGGDVGSATGHKNPGGPTDQIDTAWCAGGNQF